MIFIWRHYLTGAIANGDASAVKMSGHCESRRERDVAISQKFESSCTGSDILFGTMCYTVTMLRAIALIICFIIAAIGPVSFAAESHGMTSEEALNALKEVIQDVKVLEVNTTPVKGLFEVVVESKGQKGIVYLDSSRAFLVSGSIIDIAKKKNLTQERFAEINKVNVADIPLEDALVMGDKNAPKKVIVFTDPDCPYCAKLHHELKKVLEERKDIVFFIKMYPLPMHKDAYGKAKAIVCEKSLALLDDAFAKKTIPAATCETSVIDDNLKLAERLGIRGTPAVIMPNGVIVPGYKDAPSLIRDIDNAS